MVVKPAYLIGAGAVAVAFIWLLMRKAQTGEGFAYTVGSEVASVAFDMADGVLAGTVEAVGQKVGVPKTNMSECEKAKAEGRTWDASFACPASDFIKYVWS